jgi:hypothetical protein
LILQPLSHAQTQQTPAEKQCRDAIQGKVAWDLNRPDLKSWADDNLAALCTATSDAAATLACFQTALKRNNRWQEAIAECKATFDAPQEQSIASLVTPDRHKLTRLVTFDKEALLGAFRFNTTFAACMQACIEDKRCMGFAHVKSPDQQQLCMLAGKPRSELKMQFARHTIYVELVGRVPQTRSTESDELANQTGDFFDIVRGKGFFVKDSRNIGLPPIATMPNVSALVCASNCINRPDCMSAQYDSDKRICYLGDKSRVNSFGLYDSPSDDYLEPKRRNARAARILAANRAFEPVEAFLAQWKDRNYGFKVSELGRMFDAKKAQDLHQPNQATLSLTVYECAARCLADELTCRSFSYDRVRGLCALNTHDSRTQAPTHQPQRNVDYFEFKPARGEPCCIP